MLLMAFTSGERKMARFSDNEANVPTAMARTKAKK